MYSFLGMRSLDSRPVICPITDKGLYSLIVVRPRIKVRSQSVTKDLDQNIWFPRPNLAKLSESLKLQWKVDWWNIVGYFLVIPMCKTSFTKQFRCGNTQKCWIFQEIIQNFAVFRTGKSVFLILSSIRRWTTPSSAPHIAIPEAIDPNFFCFSRDIRKIWIPSWWREIVREEEIG